MTTYAFADECLRITLKPENPEFGPIVLRAEAESEVAVVAELLEVLGPTRESSET